MNLLDLYEGREPYQQAIDRLEQRRIKDLEAKMDDYARRGMKDEFQKCKAERDSYHKVKMDEGSMKQWLWKEAERLEKEDFIANADEYGMSAEEAAEWWDNINGVDESGIGQDIANKTEKMARATPPTPAGKVASTVKNAAKWLAGKGGPGKEGPAYEDVEPEGETLKNSLHTIIRVATHLDKAVDTDEDFPEWVSEKIGAVKELMVGVMDYEISDREMSHDPDAINEKLKGLPGKKLGSARDAGKSVRKFRAQRGLEEAGTDSQWSKESNWKTIPKAKSGKPVDPRGEVTHLSDVARREAERNAAQKKNSKPVDEEGSGPRNLAAAVMLKKARAAFPIAGNDAEALALYIADKEQRDVDHLEKENEYEEEMIARIMDQLKKKDVSENNNPKLDALIKNIQARIPKEAVKRPEIMKRVAQMVQQADPTVQDAMATAQQLVQQYGQSRPEIKQTNVNDIKAQARSGDVMAKLPKTSPGATTYAQQHATFEGWSDAIVAQRTGRPRTPYSVYIKGKKWRDFENDDHAEAVANKLRAKFKADGRDPSVITIAATDSFKNVKEDDPMGGATVDIDQMAGATDDTNPGNLDEAGNPAQQAAIAIAMKKAGKKPKQVNEEDQVKKVFKDKSGKPVGEIGTDPEASPGNGNWYVKHYASGYDVVGFDNAEEAVAELKHCMKQGITEGPDLLNMSDLQFYKELLAVLVIPIAGLGAAAWHRAQNALKLYRAEDVITALNKKGITVDRGTFEQIKPLLLKLEQAIDVDQDGDAAKELAQRIQQTVAWGKLKQAPVKPKSSAQGHDEPGVAESQTDFQKRRQRERDVDAGRPVKALPKNPQTDYAKKRAKEKRELDEFAPSPERDDDNEVPNQILKLANRWWNNAEKQPQITNVLRSLGWSIAQVESEDDAVQLQHNDGTTYFISADDFDPDVFEEKTRLDPKCWTGKKIGNPKTKMKGGVRVNNCVPAEESYTGVMESQGITDPKLLEVARKIDLFAKTVK